MSEPTQSSPRGTESTSAALARVTAERDAALEEARKNSEWLANALADKQRLANEYGNLTSLSGDFRRTIRDVTEERDGYRAYIDDVNAELAEARAALSWVVARDANYVCEHCGQTIRRGEAYVPPQPDGDDLYAHVRCPDQTPKD